MLYKLFSIGIEVYPVTHLPYNFCVDDTSIELPRSTYTAKKKSKEHIFSMRSKAIITDTIMLCKV